MVLHNAAVTGSLTVNGVDVSSITGSSPTSASFAAQIASLNTATASLNNYTSSNNTNISALNAQSASFLAYTASNDAKITSLNTFSSSILSYTSSNDANIASIYSTTSSLNSYTSSANTRFAGLDVASGSAITRLNALEVASGSAITRLSLLETASGSAIGRLNALETASGSAINRLNSIENKTGSYATTGSNIFVGTQTITGSIFGSGSLIINGCITSTGQIVAQTINVQTVTSSIVYSCGSNIFGTSISNTQIMTGSVFITGSNITANVSNACFAGAVCASTVISTGQVCSLMVNTSCIGIGTTSPSEKLDVFGKIQARPLANGSSGNYWYMIGSVTDVTNYGVANGIVVENPSLNSYAMTFGTQDSYITGITEKMRITSTGVTCFACQVCAPQLVINNQTNISPDANGTGQLMIQGNGYQGYTALDATAMYIGHNSQIRNLTFQTNETNRLTINGDGIACFSCQVCAPSFIGGTISGTTIYGSTAVCSPVGKFTSCIDAGSGTFSGNIGITVANTPEVLLTHSNTSKTFLMAVDGSNAFFRANSTNNILFQYAGGTTALTINGSTGAACFSSTVCAPMVLASGCIGINTTAPDSLLHVLNCSNTPYNDANTLASGQWSRTSNPSTCTGATSGIIFVAQGPGGGNGLATINGVTTSCGSMAITFGTRNTSGNVTERMRIGSCGLTKFQLTPSSLSKTNMSCFSSGYVYLGNFQGVTNEEVGLFGGNDPNSLSAGMGIYRECSSNWAIGLRFYTHVSSTGVGVSDLNRALDISGDGIACFQNTICATNIQTGANSSLSKSSIRLRSANDNKYLDINSFNTCNIINSNYGDSDIPLILGTYFGHQVNQLFLATNCNVGIGTSTPCGKLQVSLSTVSGGCFRNAVGGEAALTIEASGNSYIQFMNNSSSQTGIMFGNNCLQYSGMIWYRHDQKQLMLGANNTEIMYLCGGNVGIGAASPAYKLDVRGYTYSAGYILNPELGIETVAGSPYAGMFAGVSSFPGGYGSVIISSRPDLATPIVFATSNGSVSTERVRIAGNGIACFACQVCTPLLTVNSAVRLYGNASGIGCAYIVTAAGADQQPAIILEKSGGYGQSEIRTYYNSVPDYGLAFRAGTNTGMYLSSAGTLSLSPTSGYTPLSVGQNNSPGGYLYVAGDHRIANGGVGMFEYVGTVPAGGNSCVLVIPTQSQGNLHTRATYEIHGVSAEYNLNGSIKPFGGIIAIEYLNNVNVIQAFNLYGTLCGVAASANCIRLSFNTQYNTGASCGVTLRIKLLTTLAWTNYFNVMSME